MASADGILIAVRLTGSQAKFIEETAKRGGEISFNWENCRPDVAAMVTELVEKNLVTDMRAHGRLRLTDQGRSAVSQIEQATRGSRRLIQG